MAKKIFGFFKREMMLTVSLVAAVASLFITPPSEATIAGIDWRTLGTLFMMLAVLEGFKKENIFRPLVSFGSKFRRMTSITLFLVFGVFFTSMFVTNDVSLIIFVPLTIAIFRGGNKEKYILPVITFENIAAIRGSLLTPFGSPQNLFLFGQSGVDAGRFVLHMLPLSVMSAALLIVFIFFLYRKNTKEELEEKASDQDEEQGGTFKNAKFRRALYVALFVFVVATIVTRTTLWPYFAGGIALIILIFDAKLLLKVDYVLLLTFFCFFVFSSSIASNEAIAGVLRRAVAGNEYWWSIGLSQAISNVPSTIVLYPFTENFAGLIYGADTAGLVSIIGSLASVINYRIYIREYPGNGGKFLKTFTFISLAFFAIVVIPGFLLSFWNFL